MDMVKIKIAGTNDALGFVFKDSKRAIGLVTMINDAIVDGRAAIVALDDFGHVIPIRASLIEYAVYANEAQEAELGRLAKENQKKQQRAAALEV